VTASGAWKVCGDVPIVSGCHHPVNNDGPPGK
jgi:hypothetical protein